METKQAYHIRNNRKKQEQNGNSPWVLALTLTFKANACIPFSVQGKGQEAASREGGGRGTVTPGRKWAQKPQVWGCEEHRRFTGRRCS